MTTEICQSSNTERMVMNTQVLLLKQPYWNPVELTNLFSCVTLLTKPITLYKATKVGKLEEGKESKSNLQMKRLYPASPHIYNV